MDNLHRFENVVLRELSRQWTRSARDFGWAKRLTPPVFKLHDGRENLGRWRSSTREISLSRHLVFERSWNETIEVLKHEMAHQYCTEILHCEESPHGKTFQAVCYNHKIDSAPRGIPDAARIDAPNHIVERIRRLLELASGNTSKNEAEVAAATAHALMLRYNIELRDRNAEQNYVIRYVGRPLGRIQSYHGKLSYMLRKHYFVECLWTQSWNPRTGKVGHELEIAGTAENADVAEYVHEFVDREAMTAWERARKDPSFSMTRDEDRDDEEYEVPQSSRGYTLAARTSFLTGFVAGFISTLRETQLEETQAGLVLVSDPALEAFWKNRHPHTVRIGSHGGTGVTTWASNGFSAGKGLNVPVAARAAKTAPLLKG